jgi:hypothetical protein
MPHAHEAHGHDHSSYFSEQLATIAVSAGYAGVMIVLAYVALAARGGGGDGENTILSIVAGWIQYMVLFAGVVLLVLVIVRAIAVWRLSKTVSHEHHHHHHDHEHGHDHHHGHDHDHGWSPMRFIPLVLPLVIFFLPFDWNQMISAFQRDLISGGDTLAPTGGVDPAGVAGSFGIGALGEFGMNGVGGWEYALGCALSHAEEETVLPVDAVADMDQLDQAAKNAMQREHWRSLRRVELEGMLNKVGATDQGLNIFRVVRLRMSCCINDARPAFVHGLSRKEIPLQEAQWVSVQGKVDFHNVGGQWAPFLRAYQIKKAKQPPNPYLK